VLTLVLLLVGFYVPLKTRLRAHVSKRRDNKVAKRAWSELGVFVQRFGGFIDASREDTLHGFAERAPYLGGDDVAQIIRSSGLVPIDVFYGLWEHLRQHCEERNVDLALLLNTLNAFNRLVGTYNYHVVQVVFDRARAQLRPVLTPDTRSALELRRERFFRFLDDYATYLQGVNAKLTTDHIQVVPFQRVGPL